MARVAGGRASGAGLFGLLLTHGAEIWAGEVDRDESGDVGARARWKDGSSGVLVQQGHAVQKKEDARRRGPVPKRGVRMPAGQTIRSDAPINC